MSNEQYQVVSAPKQKSPTSRTRAQSGKNTSRSRAKSGKKISHKTRAQRRVFQQQTDRKTTVNQRPREKSTKAERDITHPAVGTMRKSLKYITYNSLVPYPCAPQAPSKDQYGSYINNYEQYARTIQMIDAINTARINGKVQPPKEFEISEFIQRRIAANKRKHLKRAQKQAQHVVKPEEGTEQPFVVQATIKELPIKTKEVKIVEKLDENLEALNTAIEKMENLKTQPIQVVKIKDKRAIICALNDTATNYQSLTTAIKAPIERSNRMRRILEQRELNTQSRKNALEAIIAVRREKASAIHKDSTICDLKEQKPVVSPQIKPNHKTSRLGSIVNTFSKWKIKKS